MKTLQTLNMEAEHIHKDKLQSSILQEHGIDCNLPLTAKFYCLFCKYPIRDQFYLMMGTSYFHTSCLRCSLCQRILEDQASCYERDGKAFCRGCYQRLKLPSQCHRCQMHLTSSDLVLCTGDFVYHVTCFTCAECRQTLATGDLYGIFKDEIYCMGDLRHLKLEDVGFCGKSQRRKTGGGLGGEKQKKKPKRALQKVN